MKKISVTDSIPHRGAMLLIDDVVSFSGDEIVCSRCFRQGEHFFDGHYPDDPIVPGVILCECAAQGAAILMANRKTENAIPDGLVPVLTRLNNVRFKKLLRPGDKIEITVRLNEVVSSAYYLSATIRHEGKTAATLDLACTIAPRPENEGSK